MRMDVRKMVQKRGCRQAALSIATLLALVAFSGGVSPLAQEVSE